MAGLILLLFITHIPAQAQAIKEQLESEQAVLPYKAKAAFKQDTIQFLEYNFFTRNVQYNMKTVSDLLKDMDMPVLYITVKRVTVSMDDSNEPSRVESINLVVKQKGDTPNDNEDYYVRIYFADPPTIKDFNTSTGYDGWNNNTPAFTQKIYNYLKDMVVKGVDPNEYILRRRLDSQKRNEPKKSNE